MAEIETLPDTLKDKVRPHLKEHLDPDSWGFVEDILTEGVYTYPHGDKFVTLNIPGFPAMQFDCATGEFMELTNWDYIQTVDVEAQLAEAQRQAELETLEVVLTHYLRWDLRICADFETIIAHRKTLTVNGVTVYEYPCPGQTIYLKEDMYPITYGKQRVKGDRYQYNFMDETGDPSEADDLYTDIARYEWQRNSIFED